MSKYGSRDGERAGNGKFDASPRCDCCSKPVGRDHCTDYDVCRETDGPGFYVCSRVRCGKKLEGKTVEERRVIYTAGRKVNDAARVAA
jgi:hypothetical protein